MLQFKAEDPDGTVMALVLGLVDAGLAGGDEAALLHHTARGGIIDEMTADE